MLSLKPMQEVITVDAAARRLTADAGISCGQLGPYLDGKDYAPSQPRSFAAYLDCRGMQHGHARIRRDGWKPAYRGGGAGIRDGGR